MLSPLVLSPPDSAVRWALLSHLPHQRGPGGLRRLSYFSKTTQASKWQGTGLSASLLPLNPNP